MNRTPLSLSAAFATIALAGAPGCGSDPAPPAKAPETGKSAAVSSAEPTTPPPRKDTATPTSGSVHIEDRILKACGDIPEAHFAFDSASIEAAAKTSLAALAQCFVSGPLKGRSMKLEGHADPRGADSYNTALGQKRAGSVAAFLSSKGLVTARIATTSVGSAEATGTDEEGWAKDRRVEVFLAE